MTAIASRNVRGKVAQELADIALAHRKVGEARSELAAAIQAAKKAGATNQEIGDILGVSRQRVSQLLNKP